MSRRLAAHERPPIRVVDEDYGAIVADSPKPAPACLSEALWRRSESPGVQLWIRPRPVDFAAAMRRVEEEIYDAD